MGVTYTRPLSASRVATLRLSLGPSVTDIAEAPEALVTGRVPRVAAEGSFDYQFSRLWQAGASYRRSTEFLPGFTQPVFADSATVELMGLPARRLDVSVTAGFATGESILSGTQNRFDTYTGTTRVRFAVTRTLAVYTEYLYYFYDMRGQFLLAPGLPPTFEQHGARVGMMLWVPLF
jgi:hypothetical protein